MRKYLIFYLVASSFSCVSQSNEIILVNSGNIGRKGIAKEIEIINSFDPKVIVVDVQFSKKTQYNDDLILIQTLWECKNIVMASVLKDYTGEDKNYQFTYGSSPLFIPLHAKTGFISTLLEKDDLQTMKLFSTHEIVDGKIEYHLAIQTALAYDSVKALRFVMENAKIIDIDFKNGARKFKIFSASQLLNSRISKKDIKGKIVMIGFLGPGDDDKFFTPHNKRHRPYKPDMYGVECWANIVAQVLER